ncbi:LEAF RUST 10 DISEASE-RESISTANCE LOCUS RECEPTOR-LIKE PROTEIN KINASE-like 1.4 isoform X3 [Diospyros lotus]|uniref:LEAF RUST 10 DISEASE-RESISTANCE LOCUS RECEPTOR-LIKE PROTEIN KINASE-like 1.4 isoform X3 n=1 Tax=Diospyros lotus TaxID=55363 RepID=UPI002252DDB4|nr:LEAF RUST 10 DISEASE-RESISTANCE LOCUS RECEPTOR-LIKE PROTEIN KINASE-like 1.4 isoform X3 [Diospyros lotus]
MPPLFSSSILTAAVLLLIFSGHFAPSPSATATTFPNCQRNFTCGSLRDITYPFTGGDRPYYCGPPEFNLTCRDDTYAEITINSVAYRVLDIEQTQQTLVLARLDLWNKTCPERFINSTFKPSPFSSGVRNQDLTLVYGCVSVRNNYTFYNRFTCAVNGINATDSFYIVGPVPVDPILHILTTCHFTVKVLVLSEAAEKLSSNQTTVAGALMKGFNVNYRDPHAGNCLRCLQFGDQCGYDHSSGEPICICGDQRCSVPKEKESQTSTSPSKKASTDLALFITGAIVAGIGIGWGIFACRQRRKRRAAQSSLQSSQSLEAKSKDIPSLLPVSSSPIAHSSTNYSKSIPSYPSPKSEIGKASTYFGVQVFSFTELEESTDNFDPSRELGDGGFGTVYKGKLQDGRVVAVKRLYENNFKRVEQFMNEVEILTRLRHENLVTLHGCTSRHSRELLLVYEYIPNGTVADHLHGRRANSRLLSWPIRLNIAVETAEALAYLHASDTVHRDVKTNNILLDNDFHVKVADFGLSRLFPNDVTHVSTAPQGTPGYVDPEYYQCYQLTEKSDVYSFGVVLIELISSKQAVDTNRDRQDINLANMAVNKIQNHALHELVDPSLGFETNSSTRRMTTLVAELAFRCLQAEKDMRPTMKEVLEALRRIKNQELNAEKPEVVDIVIEDEVGLLQGSHPPVSPDSNVGEKWFSSSTTPNSSG